MMTLRALMLLAVVGLFASNDDASAAGKGKKKKDQTFRGVVVSVEHEKGKKQGTITVKHLAGKTKGKTKGNAETKTFTIDEKTRIHTGGEGQAGAAKLHKGQRVAIRYQGNHADDIKLGKGKQKKKK